MSTYSVTQKEVPLRWNNEVVPDVFVVVPRITNKKRNEITRKQRDDTWSIFDIPLEEVVIDIIGEFKYTDANGKVQELKIEDIEKLEELYHTWDTCYACYVFGSEVIPKN